MRAAVLAALVQPRLRLKHRTSCPSRLKCPLLDPSQLPWARPSQPPPRLRPRLPSPRPARLPSLRQPRLPSLRPARPPSPFRALFLRQNRVPSLFRAPLRHRRMPIRSSRPPKTVRSTGLATMCTPGTATGALSSSRCRSPTRPWLRSGISGGHWDGTIEDTPGSPARRCATRLAAHGIPPRQLVHNKQ